MCVCRNDAVDTIGENSEPRAQSRARSVTTTAVAVAVAVAQTGTTAITVATTALALAHAPYLGPGAEVITLRVACIAAHTTGSPL